VFISAVPITKLLAWGERDSGGHVLRETTSRGLGGQVCPSRTCERGEKGDCVKEGEGVNGSIMTTRVPRPTSFWRVFGSASKKKKIYIGRIKKISYEPRRNFLVSPLIKKLLPIP